MLETAIAAATLYLLKPIRASSDSVSQPTLGRLSIPVTHSFASVNFREDLSSQHLGEEIKTTRSLALAAGLRSTLSATFPTKVLSKNWSLAEVLAPRYR